MIVNVTFLASLRSFSLILQVKPDGRAFSGQRFDQAGQIVDLWHGTRVTVSGPPAVPPKLGVAWLVGALVGRAKARLEIFLSTSDHSTAEHWEKSKVTGSSDGSRLLAGVASDCSVARSLCPFAAEPVAVLAAAREQQRNLNEAINVYEDLLFLEPPVMPHAYHSVEHALSISVTLLCVPVCPCLQPYAWNFAISNLQY